jgi:hypothetical protein
MDEWFITVHEWWPWKRQKLVCKNLVAISREQLNYILVVGDCPRRKSLHIDCGSSYQTRHQL